MNEPTVVEKKLLCASCLRSEHCRLRPLFMQHKWLQVCLHYQNPDNEDVVKAEQYFSKN